MSEPIVINTALKPTYDLTDLVVLSKNENVIFVRSKKIFYCDKVYGTIENRSRVGRFDSDVSSIVETKVAAIMDAGFVGHISFKLVLTSELQHLINRYGEDKVLYAINNCCQFLFHPCAKNYYDGTNQTQERPDITFVWVDTHES